MQKVLPNYFLQLFVLNLIPESVDVLLEDWFPQDGHQVRRTQWKEQRSAYEQQRFEEAEDF